MAHLPRGSTLVNLCFCSAASLHASLAFANVVRSLHGRWRAEYKAILVSHFRFRTLLLQLIYDSSAFTLVRLFEQLNFYISGV